MNDIEKSEDDLRVSPSVQPGASHLGVLQDPTDPKSVQEAEKTHVGEFGTKRDLVRDRIITTRYEMLTRHL